MNDPKTARDAARRDAKRILRLARTGALATLDGGAPLTTLVGVASDWDGSPLFLLSQLARHTKNLDVDDRVSLLLNGEGGRGDPLNHPRISLNGRVRRREGEDGKQRYAQRNPKAKLYIDFPDMSLRRLEVDSVHFNGGFGRADPLGPADLLVPGDSSALQMAERALLAQAADLGDAALSRLVGHEGSHRPGKLVGIDAEGLDCTVGGEPQRVDFFEPAWTPEAWWEQLAVLVGL